MLVASDSHQTSSQLDPERREDIQGLRAIAVTAVVCFHAGLPLPGGFAGVDVFFVISGFVITLMLEREWQRRGSIGLPSFYFRRFKRLFPALSLLVSVSIAASALFLSPFGSEVEVSALTGIGAVLIAANAVIATRSGGYFDPAAEGNPLLNTWTLSVEEQFYLLAPVLLLAAFRIAKRGTVWRYTPIAVTILLGLLSISAAFKGSSGARLSPGFGLLIGFYSPFSRAWEFAAGCALALCGTAFAPRSRAMATALGLTGLVLIGVSFFFIIAGAARYPGPLTLLPVIGTMALIFAGTGQGFMNPVSKMLGTRPLVHLGNISYSWYLWHWPVLVFASMLYGSSPVFLTAAAALSLFPAFVSYHWVENPLRRLGPMSWPRAAKFIAMTLLPPLAICSLLLFSNSKGYWSSRIKNYQESIDSLHAGHLAGCAQGSVPNSTSEATCQWNAKAAGIPIYLIGDSNADHFSEAVIKAGSQIGSPVRISTKGGCAFVGRSWSDRKDQEQALCLGYLDNIMTFLERSRPGVVVIGISDSIWRAYGARTGPTREAESADPDFTRPYLQRELTSAVSRIQRGGHRVLLLQSVPKFVTNEKNVLLYEPSKCNTVSVLLGDCPRRVTVTSEYQDELQRDSRDAIGRAAEATGSELLDFRSVLCPQGQCSNIGADGILYRDAGHLTVAASAGLADIFAKKLVETTRGSEMRPNADRYPR